MKKIKFSLIFPVLLSLFTSISCVSQTTLTETNNSYTLISKTTFSDVYFALERDYNTLSHDKTNEEIVYSIASEIASTLNKYNILYDIKNKSDEIYISFTSSRNEIENIIKSITNDPKNPLLYYEDDELKVNINRDNYMDLKAFLPLLENETVYSYTAAFNADTSADEYIEIISYVLSEKIATTLEECEISFTINDEYDSKNISFTLLDFLLLHSPITL